MKTVSVERIVVNSRFVGSLSHVANDIQMPHSTKNERAPLPMFRTFHNASLLCGKLVRRMNLGPSLGLDQICNSRLGRARFTSVRRHYSTLVTLPFLKLTFRSLYLYIVFL
jgi:hypothetical protein